MLCVFAALFILMAPACGSGEQKPANASSSVAPVRRPTGQLAWFTVQLEIRSSHVDYRITSDTGGRFASQRIPCSQQICTFSVRAGGHDLQFAVDSSGRSNAPEIQHLQYVVIVRECRSSLMEVDSTILTCNFSF